MGSFIKSDKIFCLILWILLSEFSSPGHNFYYLTFFQFIPFFYIINKYKKRWIFHSFFYSLIFYILYYRWLIYPVKFIDASPFILGSINVILMAIYQTVYFLVFAYFYKKYNNIYITSIIWGILELIKGNILTGFPWGEISYNLYNSPKLIQIAQYINSEGLSAFIIFVNLFIFSFLKLKKITKIFGFMIILTFLLINFFLFYSYKISPINLKVALVQGNVPENIKLEEKNAKLILDKYIHLTKKLNYSDLVIWPEAIYTIPFENDNSSMKLKLLNFIKNKRINLIFGSPTIEIDYENQKYKYYNSMFLITKNLKIFRYDKIKLVPFGEFTPYKKVFFFINKIVPGEDYSSGKKIILFKIKNYKIIPLICYEGIFHSLITKGISKGGDFIVNISNEAWFGNSYALYQHIAANVLRAVEFRKYFFKCANSGISAVINPKGEIVKILKPLKTGIILF